MATSLGHGADPVGADALFIVIGDQHSAYARTAQFVAQVDRTITENPHTPLAVLINGDLFEQGNVIARRSAGAIDFAMLTALAHRAPTVVNLGNHESEFYDVATSVARLEATGVEVVGNLADRITGKLFARPAVTLHLGRTEVVIAGLTTDLLSQYRAAVRPTLDLSHPAMWAQEKFPTLLAVAPVRIILSHAGLRLDREMFPFVPDGTLIAGAHDHARFSQALGHSLYFQSGSWNDHLSIVALRVAVDGPHWSIKQREIRDTDPAEAKLSALITETTHSHLTAADGEIVGRTVRALPRAQAARWVVRAVRLAAGVDAAFIGNTTFGDGLPAGNILRMALDACVRFDGTIWIGEISGARLRALMEGSNQGPETPFEQREGEFMFADGPAEIDPAKRYQIATNDWGVTNQARYFGPETIEFRERAGLRLKSIVMRALSESQKQNKAGAP